jgi:hypothetical protein
MHAAQVNLSKLSCVMRGRVEAGFGFSRPGMLIDGYIGGCLTRFGKVSAYRGIEDGVFFCRKNALTFRLIVMAPRSNAGFVQEALHFVERL